MSGDVEIPTSFLDLPNSLVVEALSYSLPAKCARCCHQLCQLSGEAVQRGADRRDLCLVTPRTSETSLDTHRFVQMISSRIQFDQPCGGITCSALS
jgi:hypothetical protein